MDFGWALEQLKKKKRLQRSSWNYAHIFIKLQNKDENESAFLTDDFIYIDRRELKSVSNALESRIPWIPSQKDILAEDWELYKA